MKYFLMILMSFSFSAWAEAPKLSKYGEVYVGKDLTVEVLDFCNPL